MRGIESRAARSASDNVAIAGNVSAEESPRVAATQVLSKSVGAESPAAGIPERNWKANLRSLGATQPGLRPSALAEPTNSQWVFARDSSLTAMLPGERWWAGCSVPRAAARVMLGKMQIGGNVACFLSPVHAAQVRVALDMLEPWQAAVALVPDPTTLWVMLHCDDFSQDITEHRLWFAAGEKWEEAMERLFVENPGLAPPAQFIRPILADPEPADRLIAPAQKIFAAENARRAEQIRSLTSRPRRVNGVRRLCVIAPSRFRLWNPAPDWLINALSASETEEITVRRFDTDDPASSSALALASAIAECDAVVSANFGRADAPDMAAADVPWVSWMTTPRISSGSASGPHDSLLLADPAWRSVAIDGGWSADRVHVASCPTIVRNDRQMEPSLAFIADTQLLQPPKRVEDYSSHKLLWEIIADELLHDPFAIGDDAEKYLGRKTARLQIADAGFDAGLFIERLIIPAYQQGLARLLVREAIPVRIWGEGWRQIESLAVHREGEVTSADEFEAIVAGAIALVHPWPSRTAHPIDAVGRPVIRAFGRHRDSFLRDAGLALKGSLPAMALPSQRALSWKLIAPLLG